VKGFIGLALVIGVAVCCTACQKKDDFDPNYSTKIKLTPEEEAKSKELMAGQKAPGAITPGQAVEPGAMKLPPGKGR
jgi:hypothetical protein